MAHFKLDTELRKLNCRFDQGEELEFRYTSPTSVIVHLKQHECPDKDVNAICTAIALQVMEEEVKAEIAGYTEREEVLTHKLQPSTVELIDRIFADLRKISQSTVTIFHWLHGLDYRLDPYGQRQAWYSEDGTKWFRYSLTRSIHVLLSEALTVFLLKTSKLMRWCGR
jgi:hypothetical protein